MVGMGSLEHLKILLNDPNTHEEYAHLWNTTSTDWAERSDVYIKFDDLARSNNFERSQNL